MFKSLILLTLLFFGLNAIYAQHILFDWQNCIKGGKYNTTEATVCPTTNGYFISAMQERGSPVDIVLTKTSLTGDSLWSRYYGGSDAEWPCGIFPTMDDNYYLVGTESSTDGDITYNPYPGFANIWVVKIDSSGNKLWDKVYGGSNKDEAVNAIVTYDGGLAVLGSTFSYNGDITTSYGARDIWVLKLDNNGNKQWDFTIGTPGFDYAYGITQTQDSGFIISGAFQEGSQGNIQCYNADSNYVDGFLYRLDKHGAPVSKKCYQGSHNEYMRQVIELPDGYLIAAITSSPDVAATDIGYHTGSTHTGYPTEDVWLQKTDPNWNIEWQRCYGGTGIEHFYYIYPCANGDYMMFGTTSSNNGDVSGIHGENPTYTESDIWMVRINATGDILWQRCIGTYGDQWISQNSVLKLGEADYVIACTIAGGGYDDILCTYEYTGVTRYFTWLFQVTDTAASVGINEQQSPIHINLYPNPATDYITLEIPAAFDMKHTQAEILDASGKRMQSSILTGHKPYIYTGDLLAGIYLLWLVNKEGFVSKRFVKLVN
jgi:hypothetical protein